MKFKKTDTIGKVLEHNENAEEILTSFGMHCLFCPCSQAESIEEACAVHGIDAEMVLAKLNEGEKPKKTRAKCKPKTK